MKNKNAGTSLFLMEMIIIVLFFSVASATCVQAFVNSHLLDEHTKELNHAVIIAQGFADVMRGTDGELDSLLAAYPDAAAGESGLTAWYDKEFYPCEEAGASYVAEVQIKAEGKLNAITVTVRTTEENTEIYTLSATKYMGNR
ncbi:MAG: hypothetical protein K5770_08550 [Lachnospiraceae bacterium]|nr:hypothetical protein [Lachnospiraceae bacterium]